MKKIIVVCILCFSLGVPSLAKEGEPEQLYAQSAVLMDAESGRVLFGKEETVSRAMASTTKIMTCILALELGDMDDVVMVSEYAAKQPKVHLGMRAKEQFYLKDLLYSLMLESHNDSAVAIAEHLGGSVEGFAKLMNQKAKELGCQDTYYITPNGLDATDEQGTHSTTAVDLALTMSYCIRKSPKKEEFLKITQTGTYSFSNLEGTRAFSCVNHNAFLSMMEGAISGKTGFTADAGYCYVGALERDGKTFVVALLACGWPNNKSYKWSDTRTLMQYGLEYYDYETIVQEHTLSEVVVAEGIDAKDSLFGQAKVQLEETKADGEWTMLLHKEEAVESKVVVSSSLTAPVEQGETVGYVTYYLDGKVLRQCPVVTTAAVERRSILWMLQKLMEAYVI